MSHDYAGLRRVRQSSPEGNALALSLLPTTSPTAVGRDRRRRTGARWSRTAGADASNGATTIGLGRGPVTVDRPQVPADDLHTALGAGALETGTTDLVCGSVGSRRLLVALRSWPRSTPCHTGAQSCYVYTTETGAWTHRRTRTPGSPIPPSASRKTRRPEARPGLPRLSWRVIGPGDVAILQGTRMGRRSVLRGTVRRDGTTTLHRTCALSATGRLTIRTDVLPCGWCISSSPFAGGRLIVPPASALPRHRAESPPMSQTRWFSRLMHGTVDEHKQEEPCPARPLSPQRPGRWLTGPVARHGCTEQTHVRQT